MQHGQSVDFGKLIPELADWNNGEGIPIEGWLGIEGDYQLAIAFSRLFWPDFAEYDNCVLFAGFSPKSYHDFMNTCHGDRAAVEKVMNHLHMLDLFYHASDSATADQLAYLGNVLKDAWQLKLMRDFPDRRITVTFDQGTPESLLDYVVTFWQPANAMGA